MRYGSPNGSPGGATNGVENFGSSRRSIQRVKSFAIESHSARSSSDFAALSFASRLRPKIRHLELGHRTHRLCRFGIRREPQQPFGHCALRHPLDRRELGTRRCGHIPRRRHERVDRAAQREVRPRTTRRELDEPPRAIALEDHLEDHLRQRPRGA